MGHLDLLSQGHRGQPVIFIEILCERDKIGYSNSVYTCTHLMNTIDEYVYGSNSLTFQGHSGQICKFLEIFCERNIKFENRTT
jgi:hypothetical protein